MPSRTEVVRKKREELRKKGLCIECEAPTGGKWRCGGCAKDVMRNVLQLHVPGEVMEGLRKEAERVGRLRGKKVTPAKLAAEILTGWAFMERAKG